VVDVVIQDHRFELLPQRAAFWSEQNTLIVSDIHLGKAGHFRKHGIAITRKVHEDDLFELQKLILFKKPSQVILLGDLFHSYQNSEWNDFLAFMEINDTLKFILIKGNHDIIKTFPPKLNVTDRLVIEDFSFTHIRDDGGNAFNFSGHIHPAVSIHGSARQSMTIPCFLFTNNHAILPAFGKFTGFKKIRKADYEHIYGIVSDQVIQLR
jgi:DNA ligase-associated metallophosphoesterase